MIDPTDSLPEDIIRVCREAYDQAHLQKATLFVDGKLISTGTVFVAADRKTGIFQPSEPRVLGKLPARGASLKIEGIAVAIGLKNPQSCRTHGLLHYHFDLKREKKAREKSS